MNDAVDNITNAVGVPVGQLSEVLESCSSRASSRKTKYFLLLDFVTHEAVRTEKVRLDCADWAGTSVQKLSVTTGLLSRADSVPVRAEKFAGLKRQ